MNKVLIIEDEAKVAVSVKKWLEENSFMVDIAPDGAVGRHRALTNTYDIVLLDLTLPFLSGYEVCAAIKAKHPGLPVILITAMERIEQKLSGFDAGADDYMVKPFDFRELLARIKTLLKRTQGPSEKVVEQEVLKMADMEVDLGFRNVTRNGTPIELTVKEFDLLVYLMKKNGRIASRPEIIENVWNVNFNLSTNVVDVYVNYLRKKIDRDFEPKLIHTKQGMGYYMKAQSSTT